ncbi:expressed unknown protein [Seminavis robusta]|uniref:Secreted protein n=1 Tax=Seminavis robusta TaxID=568900 RepID=A0A9N8E1K7_9STRA|nr:expressed unknown protein [Seminavis robusta]|eukprot:Sro414_g138330.1 n/a (101) ;mRNA; r:51711-52013
MALTGVFVLPLFTSSAELDSTMTTKVSEGLLSRHSSFFSILDLGILPICSKFVSSPKPLVSSVERQPGNPLTLTHRVCGSAKCMVGSSLVLVKNRVNAPF